jgi:hypothetical protein
MTDASYIDYGGIVEDGYKSPETYYRRPIMPYEFSTLSAEDMAQEAARVKKELERQLYGAILKLGEDPDTYNTDAHVVPEDEFAVNYAVKVDIARILSNIAFINSL